MDEAAVARLAARARHALRQGRSSISRRRSRTELAERRCAHRAQPHAGRSRPRSPAPRLKVVGRLGVGLDNIDVDACRARGIEVIPATGANALAVAEYVIGTAMFLLRGAYARRRRSGAGEWPRPALSNGRELAGKTLGIVGFGGIGRLAGRLGRALGMRVVGFDAQIEPASRRVGRGRRGSPRPRRAAGRSRRGHAARAARHGYAHLIDAARLARMKPGAILINTARGGVVDEAAVAAALAARPPGRRRARRVRAGAAAGRIAARGLSQPAADAAHRGCHRRIERARVDADRGEGGRGARAVRRLSAATTASPMTTITLDALPDLAARALSRAGANAAMAAATARALVYADAHGLASHGVSRVPQYATHLANGRADGAAQPHVRPRERRRGARRCPLRTRVPGLRARGRRGHRRGRASSASRSPA